MKTYEAYVRSVKRDLLRRGLKPIKAVFDNAGNCIACGEAGRCPGFHPEVAR
jgi:hypothetical protein